MKQYVDSLKQIAEKHEWKQVSETEHSITYSPDGMDGWAFSGMNLEYAQHRLAFFRKNRLISEIKLYDLQLAEQIIDGYMDGSFVPTGFISLDTTMLQWCEQVEASYQGQSTEPTETEHDEQ